jgi:chromate reductase
VAITRKVGVVVGSLRKESFTRKVAQSMVSYAPATLDCSFVEIGDLALYNQDLEASVPKAWADFRQRVRSLDALLFVTPEYNRGLPGVLKNAIDVGSRPYGQNVWDKKPAGVVSVTPGALGAMAAHHQLRHALFAVNVAAMALPEIYIANVNTLLGPDGTVANEKTRELLQKYMQALAGWIERILAPMPSMSSA